MTYIAETGLTSKTRTDAAALRLRVTTEHCPQVMLRVLNLLARHAIIPWEITYKRRARSFVLVIEVDSRHFPVASTLASRIEQIVKVRSVHVTEKRRVH